MKVEEHALQILMILSGLSITLISFFFYTEGGILIALIMAYVGIALFVVGVSYLLLSRYLRGYLEKLIMTTSQEVLKSPALSGVSRIYENQSKLLDDYASILRRTKYQVDILGVTLTSFFWNPDFKSSTIEALSRGVRFRVLILDPRSGAVKFLSRTEDRADESLIVELKRSIQEWKALQRRAPSSSSIEIRTYDEVPNSFLMITDERLFFAPYLHSVSILSSPCFEIKAGAGVVYQAYKDHFEAIWALSSTIEKGDNYGF